jgi:hypothetical protein
MITISRVVKLRLVAWLEELFAELDTGSDELLVKELLSLAADDSDVELAEEKGGNENDVQVAVCVENAVRVAPIKLICAVVYWEICAVPLYINMGVSL